MVSQVFYSREQDRKNFVNKILKHFRAEIKGKILIKVNLVSHEPYPTTTHPEMLDAVLQNLHGLDVVVGDAPAVDLPKFNVDQSSIFQICKKLGVPFVNF